MSKALNTASAALVLWWKKESGDIWNSRWFASSTIKGSPKISSNGDCSCEHRECLLFQKVKKIFNSTGNSLLENYTSIKFKLV